jgi:hypothetical protein
MARTSAITHTSRTGKAYYLHTGPKQGGGIQHFVSTDPTGPLANRLPEGFEIYETVNGQVYLRRKKAPVIREEECACLCRLLPASRGRHRYKIELRDNALVIHESVSHSDWLGELAPHWSVRQREDNAERFAHYQAVMRFILVDPDQRLFAPERYCFRVSVDDWIPIGPNAPLQQLAARFFKHLGQESIYDLY